jgi:hypothetical protein
MSVLQATVVSSCSSDEHNVCSRIVTIQNEVGVEILSALKNELHASGQKLIKLKSINIVPRCLGCRYDQPNQLAHMEYGGCLYVPSEEE